MSTITQSKPDAICTCYNPILWKVSSSKNATLKMRVEIGDDEVVLSREFLKENDSFYIAYFDLSKIIAAYFSDTQTTNGVIITDNNLFVQFKVICDGYEQSELITLMTGNPLKIMSPDWAISKTGLKMFVVFDKITTTDGVTLTEATKDYLVFRLYDASPYVGTSGITYKLYIYDGTSQLLATHTINPSSKSSDNYYYITLDYDSVFNETDMVFMIVEVTDDSATEIMRAMCNVFNSYDATFVDSSTRIYNGMPFYKRSYTFTALNAVSQLGHSSSLVTKRGTFATNLTKVLKYAGYPLEIAAINYAQGCYVRVNKVSVNEDVLTTPVFLVSIQQTGSVELMNMPADGEIILTEDYTIIRDENGNPICISDTSTYFQENILYVESGCIPASPFYVRWINRQGGYDYWMFSKQQLRKSKVSDVVKYSPVVYDQSSADYFEKTIGITATNQITVEADDLTETDFDLVSRIIYSPRIQYYDTDLSKWILINVSESEVQKDTQETMQNVEITFDLPTIQLQF